MTTFILPGQRARATHNAQGLTKGRFYQVHEVRPQPVETKSDVFCLTEAVVSLWPEKDAPRIAVKAAIVNLKPVSVELRA